MVYIQVLTKFQALITSIICRSLLISYSNLQSDTLADAYERLLLKPCAYSGAVRASMKRRSGSGLTPLPAHKAVSSDAPFRQPAGRYWDRVASVAMITAMASSLNEFE